MTDPPIERLRRIAASLSPVEYPDAAPPRVPPMLGDDLVNLFISRVEALCAPGDARPAVLRAADAVDAVRKARDVWTDCGRPPVLLWQDVGRIRPQDFAFGVTPALALIASTGSVIVDLPTARHGWSSLLVDTHVVVAGVDQLLPGLAEFYGRLDEWRRAGRASGYQVCVTGCSRTADIEKRLVVPAHGPRRVVVVLADAPVSWELVRRAAWSAAEATADFPVRGNTRAV